MIRRGGFLPGVGVGALVALAAVVLVSPLPGDVEGGRRLAAWVARNLGNSTWLFTAVLVFFVVHVLRLRRLLDGAPDKDAVVELDQLTDVWIQVFIGIGVIWTAVGMRSALKLALGDPEQALTDAAGSVLKKLVDGGILLALSTTIVGGVGGYLLRLAKTLYVGAALHAFYARLEGSGIRELLAAVQRLEHSVNAGHAPENSRASD